MLHQKQLAYTICQPADFEKSHKHTLNFLHTRYDTTNQFYYFQKKKKKNTNIFTLIAYSAKCLDDSMGNSGNKNIYVCNLPPPAFCLKDFVIQLPSA